MANTYVNRVTSDVDLSASAGALTTIADLNLDVSVGDTVYFHYVIHYDTGNNIGARFGINGPAGTLRVGSLQPNSTTAFTASSISSNNTVIVAETAGDTTDKTAIIDGIFIATAAGTLNFRACNEGSGAMTVFAGSAATLDVATHFVPTVGALALSGVAGSIQIDTPETPSAGSLALTGIAPTLQTSGPVSVTPTVGALALAGTTSSIQVDTPRSPDSAELKLVGEEAARFKAGLVLTGQQPSLIVDTLIAPTVGALTLTGAAPGVALATFLTPTAGAMTLAGASLTLDLAIRPTVTALILTGATPGVLRDTIIAPTQGALTLTGTSPTIQAVGDISMRPGAGTLALTGAKPGVDGGAQRNLGPVTSRRVRLPGTWKKIDLTWPSPEPTPRQLKLPEPILVAGARTPPPFQPEPLGDLATLNVLAQVAAHRPERVDVRLEPASAVIMAVGCTAELIDFEGELRRFLQAEDDRLLAGDLVMA